VMPVWFGWGRGLPPELPGSRPLRAAGLLYEGGLLTARREKNGVSFI
jgi:hypothetical protein